MILKAYLSFVKALVSLLNSEKQLWTTIELFVIFEM